MKYKVGDRVRIISRLTKKRNEYKYFFLKEMDKFLGKVMTIEYVNGFYYIMKECGEKWCFSEDMIECLADDNFNEENKEFVDVNKLSIVNGQYIINW